MVILQVRHYCLHPNAQAYQQGRSCLNQQWWRWTSFRTNSHGNRGAHVQAQCHIRTIMWSPVKEWSSGLIPRQGAFASSSKTGTWGSVIWPIQIVLRCECECAQLFVIQQWLEDGRMEIIQINMKIMRTNWLIGSSCLVSCGSKWSETEGNVSGCGSATIPGVTRQKDKQRL